MSREAIVRIDVNRLCHLALILISYKLRPGEWVMVTLIQRLYARGLLTACAPRFSTWVANECRRLCGLVALTIWLARTAYTPRQNDYAA